MSSLDLFHDQTFTAGFGQTDLDLATICGNLDELFLLARRYRQSDEYRELLEFIARFRRYSAFNAMLVHIQMPGARYVLPAKRWAKEYHRLPIPGAQPLVMLQPMRPIMFGFDVSQTEGRPLPEGFENPFQAYGKLDERALADVIMKAKREGVTVTLRNLGSTLGGYVRKADDPHHCVGIGLVERASRSSRGSGGERAAFADIALNANLDRPTNFATLMHELGHLYCGHVGTPDENWWPSRKDLGRSTEEFEAESVSYVVCKRLGIETPAAEYLHGYFEANQKVPPISLHMVLKAVQRIEAMLPDRLRGSSV